MRRNKITASIIPPKNKQTLHSFNKKICDFYAAQVEQHLQPLPKTEKLKVIEDLLKYYLLKR